MEVFTGDRRMPTDVVLYPDNLTHFPNTPSDDHPPGIFTQHRPQPPPQKLRPIRCNGRNSAEFSDPTNGGLDGSMMNCYGPPVQELGFLTQPSTGKQGDGKGGAECSGGRSYLGSCALPGNVGVSLENTCSLVGVECNKLLALGQKFEAELSSSSDDGQESPEAIQEPSNRKRKRRTREKLESFVESMMRSIMQKQEQLHGQMIEILEKKEKERLMREEAWKQQEIERAKREREERAQETSRSLALISFIQNLMGHEISIPVPLETPSREKEGGEVQNQEDIKCDPSYNQENQEEFKRGPSTNQEEFEHDPNNRRWPKSEVQALITVRAALSQKFNSKGSRNSVWEEVASGMSNMGFSRTAKKCKEKWDNINKYYKRLVENGSKKRSDRSKVCTYFNELDLLYKTGFIRSENHDDSSKKAIEEQSVVE